MESFLKGWFRITENADWKHFQDVLGTFNRADEVGKYVVFDVSHNRCRLIASISYKWSMVYIRAILSHAEYDRKGWAK